jgi:hypothetical protein
MNRKLQTTSRIFIATCALIACVCATASSTLPALQGLITDERLTELSGMTSVSYDRKQLWAINDGGHGNKLYAINTKGSIERELAMPEISNFDIEDLSAFRYRKQQMLAIGDIGDNGGVREVRPIYIIDEPSANSDAINLRWTVMFRFPDKRHDSESLFVDTKEGFIYLVNKRTEPPVLYRVPLKPEAGTVATAELIGVMPGVKAVQYDATVKLSDNQSKYATQPTSAALSCDRRTLSLLTYTAIYHYHRRQNQSWKDAFADTLPEQIPLPPLPQAEAISYSADCRYLYVGSERTPSPLWRFKVPK